MAIKLKSNSAYDGQVQETNTAARQYYLPNNDSGLGTQLMTAQATTSGSTIDFPNIPSWVKRIVIAYAGVSWNAGANPMVQIGNGSIVTTGYLSAGGDYVPTANHASSTAGFIQAGGATVAAASVVHGVATLLHVGNNTWVFSSVLSSTGTANTMTGSGSITLGSALDRVRITSAGAATFDAGSINVMYE